MKQILSKCVVRGKYQGSSFRPPPVPALPSFRVTKSRPFFFTGLDYAGSLFVQPTLKFPTQKVWICLFICCTTRAVHFEIVNDMTSQSFIQSFKHFTCRKGFSVRIISGNAKTFEGAEKILMSVMKSHEARHYFSDLNIKWVFYLRTRERWF